MFKKMTFHFDHEGKAREQVGTSIKDKGVVTPTPLTLEAKQINSTEFQLYDAPMLRRPAIQVDRLYSDTKNDPYNEDGRPACVLLFIIDPVFEFFGSHLTIAGLEYPNLCWAGLLAPAYECATGKIDPALILPEELVKVMRKYYPTYNTLKRQRITFSRV